MRFKIGDEYFDIADDKPVMVILTEQDKLNIANMNPDCTKYALFPDDWGTVAEMLKWMSETDDANR